MPIKEESFRIGCGRYIQGKGYISRCGEEVTRVASSPLIVGDDTALGLTRDALDKSLKNTVKKYEFITHNGTCNEERARELADYAIKNNFDAFVGVGGGVIMDFAKLCAYFAKLPTINIPTSSATCAAYTPLSVRYTPEGKTAGSVHYTYEIDSVIVDTEIIAAQPVRLLLAGMFDALAKFVEIKQRYAESKADFTLGLDYAYIMSEYSFKLLTEKTQKCIDDMQAGNITDDVDNFIFTTIAATGVISGIARGSNQTAVAHKFYDSARFLFPEETRDFLHGEIVGIGILLQNHFNDDLAQNDGLLRFMKKYGLPHSLQDIGIEPSDENLEAFFGKLCDFGAIDGTSKTQCEKLRIAMNYLWSLD